MSSSFSRWCCGYRAVGVGKRQCSSTFEASARIMFANMPLVEASHGAEARFKEWEIDLMGGVAKRPGPASTHGRYLWPFCSLPQRLCPGSLCEASMSLEDPPALLRN